MLDDQFIRGPQRQRGPILGRDEQENERWLGLFNLHCTRIAVAGLVGLAAIYAVSVLT